MQFLSWPACHCDMTSVSYPIVTVNEKFGFASHKMDFILGLLLSACIMADTAHGATIVVPPTNASVLLGSTAELYCGVENQADGESLIWTKLPNFFISQDINVVNATKFQITEKYRLHVRDVIAEDTGEYRCQIMDQKRSAWLIACDPPTSVTIEWEGDDRDVGTAGNLTCTCPRSLPPATLRWFLNSDEITDEAVAVEETQGDDGYGESISYLTVNITEENYDAPYRCQAGVPVAEDAVSDEFRFSDGTRPAIYNFILLAMVLSSFL